MKVENRHLRLVQVPVLLNVLVNQVGGIEEAAIGGQLPPPGAGTLVKGVIVQVKRTPFFAVKRQEDAKKWYNPLQRHEKPPFAGFTECLVPMQPAFWGRFLLFSLRSAIPLCRAHYIPNPKV
jgi:hypothetical protein